MASALTREILTGPAIWPGIEQLWGDLVEERGVTSAFMAPEWVGAWLESYGERLGSRAVLWRDPAGQPVGCALISRGREHIGPVPLARTFLNTSGPSAGWCEHNDVLCSESARSAVFRDLVALILSERPDELALMGVSERSLNDFRRFWPTHDVEGFVSEAPFVALDRLREHGLSYLSALSRNTRAQIRRSIRLYEESLGPCSVDVAETVPQALEWLDDLAALHRQRWSAQGEEGAFAESGSMPFHRRLVERSAIGCRVSGRLSIDLVRVRFGATTIGMLLNLVREGRVHYYQSGLVYRADDARLKPGLVAHTLAIRRSLEIGDREYDLLGGTADPVRYKQSLSTGSRSLYWVQLPAPTVKMGALGWMRRSRRRLLGLEYPTINPV